MDADTVNLTFVFSRDQRHIVPLFQRPYVWEADENWVPLWADVRAAAEEVEAGQLTGTGQATHFLGAFVLDPLPPAPRRVPAMEVIDGQQRLTTLQVLFAAARAVAARHDATRVVALFDDLLFNNPNLVHAEHPDDRFKVWPSLYDREEFIYAVTGEAPVGQDPPDGLLVQARCWFDEAVTDWVAEAEEPELRLEALLTAVRERLGLVEIQLGVHDDAQVIFETLNDRGTRLSAADLVKNTLFRRAQDEGDDLEELLAAYWAPFATAAWQAKVTTGRIRRSRLDVLITYWLTVATGAEVSVERLFSHFRSWLRGSGRKAREVLAELHTYGRTYLALEELPADHPTARMLARLTATRTNTPMPLLLLLHVRGGVPVAQQRLAVAAIDSYLTRRSVCSLTTKDYNRLLLQVLSDAQAAPPEAMGEQVVATLAAQRASSRYWPDDDDFRAALLADDVYRRLHGPRLRVLLEGLEHWLRTDMSEQLAPATVGGSLTVEHILPQAWQDHWPLPQPDGAGLDDSDRDEADELEARRAAVDRLGNLTLLTHKLNSTVSNGPWPAKAAALRTHSVLLLTTASVLTAPPGVEPQLADMWASMWDERRIETRSRYLADCALAAWPGPPDPHNPPPA